MADNSKDIAIRKDTKSDIAPQAPPRQSAPQELTTRGQQAGGFLEKAFAHLPVEKQQELVTKAIEKRIELDERSEQAQRTNDQSRDEMENAVDLVRKMSRTRTDFKGDLEGQTASGRWHLEVTRNSALVTVAVVAIVCIALAIIFGR